ncbi:MAG: hypothetical protein Q8916_00970 [Bacteroidota bacterium]|nr:hypothetical protein [Bacteroidota bacterium]
MATIIGSLFSCTGATDDQTTPVKDFSAYFPMYVGDSLVYKYSPRDSSDSLFYWLCTSTVFKKNTQYYQYEVHNHFPNLPHIDTFWVRKTSDGDVYMFSGDSDEFWIDFHTLGYGGVPGKVSKKYFSSSVPAGSFDSCIAIRTFLNVENILEATYAPNIGMIHSLSRDNEQTLIYARIGNRVYP